MIDSAVSATNTQTMLDEKSQSFSLTGAFGAIGATAAYQGAGAVVGSNLGSGNTARPFCDTDWLTIPCVTNNQVVKPDLLLPCSSK